MIVIDMVTSKRTRVLILHFLAGCIFGILLLHPITKAVYWFEFRDTFPDKTTFWKFATDRLQSDFLFEMAPMTLVFGIIGGLIGCGFGVYHLKLVGQQRVVQHLEAELARDLPSLISKGEDEYTEFKSSVRWDIKQQKVNRSLELVIAKTIVGFMNHKGGNILVGVDDDGNILGLANDYATLKHKNRDGLEQCIMGIINTQIGGDRCSLVHCVFYKIEDSDICRIIVEQPSEPVYCNDGNIAKYYLRAGNGTRELDAQETVSHVTSRK